MSFVIYGMLPLGVRRPVLLESVHSLSEKLTVVHTIGTQLLWASLNSILQVYDNPTTATELQNHGYDMLHSSRAQVYAECMSFSYGIGSDAVTVLVTQVLMTPCIC